MRGFCLVPLNLQFDPFRLSCGPLGGMGSADSYKNPKAFAISSASSRVRPGWLFIAIVIGS